MTEPRFSPRWAAGQVTRLSRFSQWLMLMLMQVAGSRIILLAVATRMAVVAMGGQIEWIAMSHSYSPDGDSRRVI